MNPTSDEYLEGYRAGYEDGKALDDVFTSGPFVVVYIDRKDPDMYRFFWRNIKDTHQAEILVLGLDEAVERMEDCIDESTPEEDDDDE